MTYLDEKNYSSKSFKENLFFTPENNLFDIFRKFIYTKGQILWVENEIVKGFMSLHDLFDYFLSN